MTPPENTAVPEPVKPVKPVKPPPPKVDPLDDRPERIEPVRLQSRLRSMEERVATRCRSHAGVPNTKGLKVTVRVAVDVKGEVKATTTGSWANTPMGKCIEEMLEALRFNETRKGGSRTHTFTF